MAGKREERSMMKEIRFMALYLIVCMGVMYLVFTMILIPARVSGTSMHPTLEDGTFVFARGMMFGLPERGNLVIVDDALGEGTHIIKRVIAVAGDTIDIHDGEVYLNGQLLMEGYTADQTMAVDESVYPLEIEPDHFFVMGDNRMISNDSRNPDIGQIAKENIRGVYLISIP